MSRPAETLPLEMKGKRRPLRARVRASVPPLDPAAIAADGALVIEVDQSMVRQRLGVPLPLLRDDGQTPRFELSTGLEQEVPVHERMIVLEHDEAAALRQQLVHGRSSLRGSTHKMARSP